VQLSTLLVYGRQPFPYKIGEELPVTRAQPFRARSDSLCFTNVQNPTHIGEHP
jgi:hypothetical protein